MTIWFFVITMVFEPWIKLNWNHFYAENTTRNVCLSGNKQTKKKKKEIIEVAFKECGSFLNMRSEKKNKNKNKNLKKRCKKASQ